MSPAIAPPPDYRTPTAAAAIIVPAPAYAYAGVVEPDFPEGIDYDRWTGIVHPSPRSAFADSLDLLDFADE